MNLPQVPHEDQVILLAGVTLIALMIVYLLHGIF